MAENSKHVYDESKIKTLSSLEHIRLRTGMYIGRIGNGSHYDDGCYILLKEVIDNAIDEFIMGHGEEVQIDIEGNARHRARFRPRHPAGQGGGLRFQDQHRREVQRRRLPVQRRPQRRRHQGGQRALEGLPGAQLSRRRVRRGLLQAGQAQEARRSGKTKEPDGTFIGFEPDPEIFKDTEFQPEHVERRLRHYSYLNTGPEADLQRQGLPVAQRACWTW